MATMHRVLVLGGGFGGIAAAVALRERLDPADEVVLVERRPTFVMGLRKNWALVGSSTLAEGERSLASLGDRGIRVVPGTIEAIDPEIRKDPNAGTAFSVFRANIPQLYVDIDRTKCKQLGIPLDDVFTTLQANLGGLYVNDFNRFGRNWQVNIQADAPFRMSAETIRNLKVRNDRGEMVSLGSVATVEDATGPLVIQRYNTFPAAAVNGNLPPGVSTGAELPPPESGTAVAHAPLSVTSAALVVAGAVAFGLVMMLA